jgi:hypothetical protein
MRRFFILLLILSLGATAGVLYWRTYMPEGGAPTVSSRESGPASRSLGAPDTASRSGAPAASPQASGRQDLALTVSIVTSIISALAALAQTWLTARALPARRPD